MNYLTFLPPFLLAFGLAFFATILTIKFAGKMKIVDDPLKHKRPKDTHTYPVPRGGGLPVFIALVIASLFFLPLDRHLFGILSGAAFTVLVGLLDDRFDLSPYLRLLTCFIVGLIVVFSGINIAFISNPFGGVIDFSQLQMNFNFLGQEINFLVIASVITVLWIVWCMNFIGWSGGVEGQLPGIVVIAAATIGLFSLRFSADIALWPVIILAAITAGGYLGFLPFNFYPQKIMPGYSGKSLAGYLLAVLAILATAKVGTLIVVLGIPLIDALYSIVRRISAGKMPFWGDRGHLHHRLLDIGWGKRKIVVFYWFVTFFLGVLALNLNSQQKFYTMIMLTLLMGAFFLWISYFTKSRAQQDQLNG